MVLYISQHGVFKHGLTDFDKFLLKNTICSLKKA